MIRVIQANDFTGGLNLEANIFQLEPNQSSDMLNIDLNQRGGFQRRLGLERINTTAVGGLAAGSFGPQRVYPWQAEQGNKIMLATDTKVFYSSGGNFTDLGVTNDSPNGAQFASWTTGASSYLYMTLGQGYASRKWDATTLTTLTASGTGAWQNDLSTPNGTHMPKAQHIAVHGDRVWVADTTESSVHHPNRVRFSHPLFPESWREQDYIDVVGGGSIITGIVPFGGHLLVFKPKGIFAIYGYSDDTFQMVEITRSIGAANSKSIVATEQGVYFFSYPDGVFMYDGKGVRDLFANLRPLIYDAEITETSLGALSMGFANKKLFLSLPTGAVPNDTSPTYDASTVTYDQYGRLYGGSARATSATVSFVYNPSVGRNGAWTVYRTADGYGYISPVSFTDTSGNMVYIAAHPHQPYVFRFDVPALYSDNVTGTTASYGSHYLMPWQDAGNYVTKKMWRRPEFVLRRESTPVSVDVEIFHDWDGVDSQKTYSIQADAVDVTGLDYSGWNDPDLGSTGVKAHSLGYAKAVQLRISSSAATPWCVNSVAYKYSPRGVRV